MSGSDCDRGPLSVLWFEHTGPAPLFSKGQPSERWRCQVWSGSVTLYVFLFGGWRAGSLSWAGEVPGSAETSQDRDVAQKSVLCCQDAVIGPGQHVLGAPTVDISLLLQSQADLVLLQPWGFAVSVKETDQSCRGF